MNKEILVAIAKELEKLTGYKIDVYEILSGRICAPDHECQNNAPNPLKLDQFFMVDFVDNCICLCSNVKVHIADPNFLEDIADAIKECASYPRCLDCKFVQENKRQQDERP